MSIRSLLCCCGLVVVWLAGHVSAQKVELDAGQQQAPGDADLPDPNDSRDRYVEESVQRAVQNAVAQQVQRKALFEKVDRLYQEEKYDEALEGARELQKLHRDAAGVENNGYVQILEQVIEIQTSRRDWDSAIDLAEEVVRLQEKLHGADSRQSFESGLVVENLRLLQGLSPEAHEELQRVVGLQQQVVEFSRNGNHRAALEPAQQSVEILTRVKGRLHPDTLVCLDNLSAVYRELGELAEAKRLASELCDRTKVTYGAAHPRYGTSLYYLARIHKLQREYQAAEELYNLAIGIFKQSVGEASLEYVAGLKALAELHAEAGNNRRAQTDYEQVLPILAQLYQKKSTAYAASLDGLGMVYRELGDYGKAKAALLEALSIRVAILGEKHLTVAESVEHVGQLYADLGELQNAERVLLLALDVRRQAVGEDHPLCAQTLDRLGSLYRRAGAYTRAEQCWTTAIAIKGATPTARSAMLNNLAGLCLELGDYGEAERLYLDAIEVWKPQSDHPDYAVTLNNLAGVYGSMGDFGRAEAFYLQAHDMMERVLGKEHLLYAKNLNNLAWLYETMGDTARAEQYCREALEIRESVLGESHPENAVPLNNLGSLYLSMQDYRRAEHCFRQAFELRKTTLGESHPACAESLNNLASLQVQTRRFAEALDCYSRAAEVVKDAFGDEHPLYATCLSNLAALHQRMGNDAQAGQSCAEALKILEKTFGKQHPRYAEALNNRGAIYAAEGNLALAEECYREAAAIYKDVVGEKHSSYVASLSNLGMLYFEQGKLDRAVPLFHTVVKTNLDDQDLMSAAQSEQQQLILKNGVRSYLDAYLSCAAERSLDVEQLYEMLFRWKGGVQLRQRWQRLARESDDPRIAQLLRTSSRLSNLVNNPPLPAANRASWQQEIVALTDEREALEAQLSRSSSEFRALHAQARTTLEQLKSVLPPNVALVDLINYRHLEPNSERGFEWRLTAFVVRGSGPVTMIPLGSSATIDELVFAWRASFGSRSEPTQPGPGEKLRQLVWEKIEPALHDADTVLISPDGALMWFPWSALPGKEPGTYLLEERAIAVVPVPQMLPELIADDESRSPTDPTLLLVGNVDYERAAERADFTPSASAVNGGGNRRRAAAAASRAFSHLSGAAEEIESVDRLFTAAHPHAMVTTLQETEASEQRFGLEAPRHRFLHLATHGFFASSSKAQPIVEYALSGTTGNASELPLFTGIHPGLLCGIVMAGANQAPVAGDDDGILTALEVGDIDLSGVELTVLSACESSLGKIAEGEGMLGLQRALQLAGSRSTITTLWQIDDIGTRMLMERFYCNLWEHNMPKLAALREAQIYFLHHPQEYHNAIIRGARVLELEDDGQPGRSPPRLWAPFIFSGNWQ